MNDIRVTSNYLRKNLLDKNKKILRLEPKVQDLPNNVLPLRIRWLDRYILPAEQLTRSDVRKVPFKQVNIQKILGTDFTPYTTQVRAWQAMLEGHAVFVVSGTGSGKTYAIIFGILEQLLRDDSTHCLIMFPMKALAQDQEAHLRELCTQFNLTVQRYDSSISLQVKAKIRETPGNLLIITPDTLLGTLSGTKNEEWHEYLVKSAVVWIDEFHAMSGTLGTALCYLIRILHALHPAMRVYCTSATLANVREIASYFPYPTTIIEGGSRHGTIRIHIGSIQEFPKVLELVLRDRGQFLIFIENKRKIESLMTKLDLFSRHLERYHADLPDTERHLILRKFINKELKGLLCTSAISLGVNIPSVRNIVLYGFPRSFALLFQELGRGTREYNSMGNLYLLLDDSKLIDNYYLKHLANLKADVLSYRSEPMVIDLLNDRILRGMVLFTIKIGITTPSALQQIFKEAQAQGRLELTLTWLLTLGYITKTKETYSYLADTANPFLFEFIMNLRPGFPKFKIMTVQADEKLELGYINAEDIPYCACKGNYITIAHHCYAIQEIDVYRRELYVDEIEERFISKNQVMTTVSLVKELKFKTLAGGVKIQLADFRVQVKPECIQNFRVVKQESCGKYIEVPLDPAAPSQFGPNFELNFTTRGLMLELPLNPEKPLSESVLYQLAQLMLKNAMVLINISEHEVDCYQDILENRVYFLDRSCPTGVSQQLYAHAEVILRKTYQVLAACPCEHGCEKCAIPVEANYLMPNFQSVDLYRKQELLTLLREVLVCE